MKIWFRTNPEHGSDKAGDQSRWQDRPVDPMSLWSLLCPVSSGTPLIENRADHSLRRGAACCARYSAANVHHPSADACATPAPVDPRHFKRNVAARRQVVQPKTYAETGQFSYISNRFWPKNRSYRKQTIKPRLTGARNPISNLQFLAPFLASASAKNPGANPAPKRPKPSHRI